MSEACSVCGGQDGVHKYFNCPNAVREVMEKARAERADHGISPAQLREKVEALERRHEQALKMCAACDANTREAIEDVMSRLDAALKRIEELEKLVTAWRGTQKYEPTPEEDARRQRAIEHINAVNERIAAQKAAKP